MRAVKIGMGAGFAYDRHEPAIELLEKGSLDYLCFECLGERTTAFAMLDKLKDPSQGYNEQMEERFDKLLDVYKRQGVHTRIVTNMGAANPVSAAEKIVEMAREKGLPRLKVAAVTGDEVLGIIGDFMNHTVMETGKPLSSVADTIVSANAYIGCAGIVEALENGADVVITGRASDPSLTLGPLVHEFGWSMDDWDRLGAGTIAGHLLECGGQITGGYFEDPGYKDVPDPWRMGFPIGIIYENGEIEITKVAGSGGLVSALTVKEQLLYEIQDPSAYLTPDCIADITNVEIHEVEKDLVRVTGVRGHAKTGLLKVNVGYRDCFIGEGEISYGGANCIPRAKRAGDTVLKRLELRGVAVEEIQVELIGITSLYKQTVGNSMTSGDNAEVRLRIAARTKDRDSARKIGDEVETLLCCGPAAGGGSRRTVREVLSLASILIEESLVPVSTRYMEV